MTTNAIMALVWCIPSLVFILILAVVAHASNKREEELKRNSTGGRNYVE